MLTKDDLEKVDLLNFKNAQKNITFDVFLRISDTNFAHVFSKTTGIDFVRLNSYEEKGVRFLYVKKEDIDTFREFMKVKPDNILADSAANPNKKATALLTLADQNLTTILHHLKSQTQVKEEMFRASERLVKHFVQTMVKSPQSLSLMIKMASHGDYLYYHSLFTSIISIFLAKATNPNNAKLAEICGLGGLLHDISYTQISKDVLESAAALTPAQWMEMRRHPQISIKMVEGLGFIPEEVKFILSQHHEEPRGTGYPAALRGPVIFYPAKVVAVADGFSALVSKRPYRPEFTIDQAIDIMTHERGKWDGDLTKVLIEIFKKKPAAGQKAA